MNFIIRCDSSYVIGSGHLMRCLTFADDLKKYGHQVHFVCAPHEGSMHNLVLSRFSLHLLSDSNLNPEDDAKETLSIAQRVGNVVIAVDHYSLGIEWEKKFSANYKIIVIDDLNRHHECDIVIDSNYRLDYRDQYRDRVPKNCLLYLGPQNSFLRDEFLSQSAQEKKINQVLVFFGGTDPTNETFKFIQAVQRRPLLSSFFHIVVSKGHSFLKMMEAVSDSERYKIDIQPMNLALLMSESELYVGSGGTITWERMFLGLPGAVVSVADNQLKIAKDLAEEGLQVFLGASSAINHDLVVEKCEELLQDKKWLKRTAENSKKLVGKINTRAILRDLGIINLRPVELSDAKFLYDLRNEESAKAMSFSNKEFSYREHIEWLSKKIHSAGMLFVILFGDEKAGQVRVDPDYTISIAIAPKFRGKGLATQAILAGIDENFIKQNSNEIIYVALIKKENVQSAKSFLRAGFVFDKEIEVKGERCLKYSLIKLDRSNFAR